MKPTKIYPIWLRSLMLFSMKICLMLFSMEICAQVPASERYSFTAKLKHQDIWNQQTSQKLTMNLRRLRRDGAVPIILSHPVVLSNLGVNSLSEYLWEQGFDVWMPNMRGHGCGEERTRVDPYTSGDYGFDKIVLEDWPLVLDFVIKHTKQKPVILGYSMGGMTWEQFLSGVYWDKDHVAQSDLKAKERAAKIAGFISLVTPTQLRNVPLTLKLLLKPLLPVLRRLHIFIPFNSNHSPEDRVGIGWSIRKIIMRSLTPLLPYLLPQGILENGQSWKDRDLNQLTSEGLSSPHTDYVSDLIGWFERDYTSKDGQIHYSINKRIFSPTLIITASEDKLALPSDTKATLFLYPEEAKVQSFEAQGFSHMDIGFQRGVKEIGPKITDFLHSL